MLARVLDTQSTTRDNEKNTTMITAASTYEFRAKNAHTSSHTSRKLSTASLPDAIGFGLDCRRGEAERADALHRFMIASVGGPTTASPARGDRDNVIAKLTDWIAA